MFGHESRGDDALGPFLIRSLQRGQPEAAEYLEDFQLQVEHVSDLQGRRAILFIDADVSCEAPCHFSEISAAQDNSYTSHGMTPFALLHTYRKVYGDGVPRSYLLRLRGYDFELGNGLSDEAYANLEVAAVIVHEWLSQNNS